MPLRALAQQNAYTWEQIHDLFLRTNPLLHAQEQSIDSNRAGEVTAGLRPNPTFQNDTTSATIGIYQEFEIGGKRTARIRSANLATQISRTDAEDTRRTLTLNLRLAFISALQAKSDLQFARDNLSNYQKTVDINKEMLQEGEIARADFLRIELEMLQFQTDLDDATLELKTAKATLRGLLGPGSLPEDFEIQGELKAVPFDKDLPELEKLALQDRPDLKSAETGRLKASADLRLAQANRWPDPTSAPHISIPGMKSAVPTGSNRSTRKEVLPMRWDLGLHRFRSSFSIATRARFHVQNPSSHERTFWPMSQKHK